MNPFEPETYEEYTVRVGTQKAAEHLWKKKEAHKQRNMQAIEPLIDKLFYDLKNRLWNSTKRRTRTSIYASHEKALQYIEFVIKKELEE